MRSASVSELLSLLDCFSGYHQIWLWKEDVEKTSFITPFNTLSPHARGVEKCRTNILQNVTKIFESQLDRNVHAYVDDIGISRKRKGTTYLTSPKTSPIFEYLKLNQRSVFLGYRKTRLTTVMHLQDIYHRDGVPLVWPTLKREYCKDHEKGRSSVKEDSTSEAIIVC